ncbi:hypothetical protein CQW23_22278 [Capsicum baccatum]|uniref:Uncharacterized protein n=1 Tax=Capsicum baccatum TaxID=33114 RepID=A0A2G2W0E9_CAPBA|nr:hypothetical protein CQW23_22278 [Capsicum baccatum]
MRAGREGDINKNVAINGSIYDCPYLLVPLENIEQNISYQNWIIISSPTEAGLHNPMINPFAEKAPCLSQLGCSRMLCFAEKDEYIPKEIGIQFTEGVKKSGWKGNLELLIVEDEALPQKFDVQSKCKSKTDAHKMFDVMSNRCCPKVFTVALLEISIEMALIEGYNGNLGNKHIIDVGDSTHKILALTLSPLTPTESTIEDEKSKEGSEVKEQVEGSKDVVQQKLIATTNI